MFLCCNGRLIYRASDKCQREKRKTINGDDLLWAMATLGFEDYIDPLKIYLTRYREVTYSFILFSGFADLFVSVCLFGCFENGIIVFCALTTMETF